ncbi:MAG: NUDIX domain-containing protein [Prolixibacteraceae bacterium]|nr:NUDIX domain-containing protein [Prolixibacteraceae bacterium]
MYKVFFNDRVVYPGTARKEKSNSECLETWANNASDVKNAWEQFRDDSRYRELHIHGNNEETIKDYFFSLFKIIAAAGGLVNNSKNELLCIHRLGKWDLPKGKIEKYEPLEIAAIREVKEECGLDQIENQGLFSITHHIYANPKKAGSWILKPTYWFIFSYKGNKKPAPQLEEGIAETRWFNKNEMDEVLANTWASIKPLIEDWISFG